jgi:hypothetical protein
LAAGSAAGAGADVLLVADCTAEDAALVAEEALLEASSLEHAAAPNTAMAARPAIATDFR